MYALLPWKWVASGLALVVATSVYLDDLGVWLGVEVPDSQIVRWLPVILLSVFSGFFGFSGYWAPWRVLWRWFPRLNDIFPDINGIWVGATQSNWPTIKKLIETSQSNNYISEESIVNIPEQKDALAAYIECSIFIIRIKAALSDTKSDSVSITAKPWRDQHSGQVHISYIYKQFVPNHVPYDEEAHLGAADLVLRDPVLGTAIGTYWTRRNWKTGRNTAGTLELKRTSPRDYKGKTLHEYAVEHSADIIGK